ncbi:unnamed protein product [Notodromas monacha]|uniref:Uncharacterized protein n=1 Tax=Notodromas monacha TaxID=399045 RepID=A0A7R9G8Z0_9CRUS|nr:unnamed protein product [Notodromas monacha]CAG0913716.1 unnamed protein product [Notodromas monacha]
MEYSDSGESTLAALCSVTQRSKDILGFARFPLAFEGNVKCSTCGDESKRFMYFSIVDEVELKTTKGSANFVHFCKFCKRENFLSIIPSSVMSYNAEDSDAFKTIVVFFCGGLEPIDFEPGFGFVVETGGSGARFEGVDLSDGNWENQDELSSDAVSISNLEFRLIKK